jgi:hypothetical protein
MKAYIAGPMTGYGDYNFPAFHHAAEWLRKIYPHAEIISPAEMDGGNTTLDRTYYMSRDLNVVINCDTIFFLPGWAKSRGATLEHDVAEACGVCGVTMHPTGDSYHLSTIFDKGKVVVEPFPIGVVQADQRLPSERHDPAKCSHPDCSGGGTKADDNKLRFDLIPTAPLRAWATVKTFGSKKYGDRNWEKGIPFSRVYAALQRHLVAWFGGEDLDPESKESHLAHAMCNVGFLLEYMLRYDKFKKFDDRPY